MDQFIKSLKPTHFELTVDDIWKNYDYFTNNPGSVIAVVCKDKAVGNNTVERHKNNLAKHIGSTISVKDYLAGRKNSAVISAHEYLLNKADNKNTYLFPFDEVVNGTRREEKVDSNYIVRFFAMVGKGMMQGQEAYNKNREILENQSRNLAENLKSKIYEGYMKGLEYTTRNREILENYWRGKGEEIIGGGEVAVDYEKYKYQQVYTALMTYFDSDRGNVIFIDGSGITMDVRIIGGFGSSNFSDNTHSLLKKATLPTLHAFEEDKILKDYMSSFIVKSFKAVGRPDQNSMYGYYEIIFYNSYVDKSYTLKMRTDINDGYIILVGECNIDDDLSSDDHHFEAAGTLAVGIRFVGIVKATNYEMIPEEYLERIPGYNNKQLVLKPNDSEIAIQYPSDIDTKLNSKPTFSNYHIEIHVESKSAASLALILTVYYECPFKPSIPKKKQHYQLIFKSLSIMTDAWIWQMNKLHEKRNIADRGRINHHLPTAESEVNRGRKHYIYEKRY